MLADMHFQYMQKHSYLLASHKPEPDMMAEHMYVLLLLLLQLFRL